MREDYCYPSMSGRPSFLSAVEISITPRAALHHPAMLPHRHPTCGPCLGRGPQQDLAGPTVHQTFQKRSCPDCQNISGHPHVLNPNAKEFIPRRGVESSGPVLGVFAVSGRSAVGEPWGGTTRAGPSQRAVPSSLLRPAQQLLRCFIAPDNYNTMSTGGPRCAPPPTSWRKPATGHPPPWRAEPGPRAKCPSQCSSYIRPPRFTKCFASSSARKNEPNERGSVRSVVAEWLDTEKLPPYSTKTRGNETISAPGVLQNCVNASVPVTDTPACGPGPAARDLRETGETATTCTPSPSIQSPQPGAEGTVESDPIGINPSGVGKDSSQSVDDAIHCSDSPCKEACDLPARHSKDSPLAGALSQESTSPAGQSAALTAAGSPSPPPASAAAPSPSGSASDCALRQRRDSRRSTTTTDDSEYSTDSDSDSDDSDCGSSFLPSSSVDSADDFICFVREGSSDREVLPCTPADFKPSCSATASSASEDQTDHSARGAPSPLSAEESAEDGDDSDSDHDFSEGDGDDVEFDAALWRSLSVSPMSLSYQPTLDSPDSPLCDACERSPAHLCPLHRRIVEANRQLETSSPSPPARPSRVRFQSGERLATVHAAPDYDRCMGSQLLDLQRQRDRQRLWRQHVQRSLAPALAAVLTPEHRARVLRQRPELLER